MKRHEILSEVCREWDILSKPWSWDLGKVKLSVVADNYTLDGVRLHIVKEDGYYGAVICSAYIFSEGLLLAGEVDD